MVVGGRVRAAREMSQEASRSHRRRHKPSSILTLCPAVAPCALPPRVPTLAHTRERARCEAGRFLGATAAPFDHLSGQSTRTTHCINIAKPPVGVFHFCFPLPMAQPPSQITTRRQPYLGRPCSDRKLQRSSCTGSSHCSHTAAVPWRAGGHAYNMVCVCVCDL